MIWWQWREEEEGAGGKKGEGDGRSGGKKDGNELKTRMMLATGPNKASLSSMSKSYDTLLAHVTKNTYILYILIYLFVFMTYLYAYILYL